MPKLMAKDGSTFGDESVEILRYMASKVSIYYVIGWAQWHGMKTGDKERH